LCQTYFPLAQQYQLSYFEFLTLLFFVHSSEAKFDINVIEVGMGGRLDATNVTQPHLTAITNIGWDHSEYLGDSLGEILKEKMGILRNTVPVVSGLRQKDLREQLKSDCERLNSPVFFSDSIPRESRSWNWSSQEVLIDGNPFSLNNPTWGTLENATLAYLLLKTGFPEVDLSVIQKAFSATVFPGRFERIQKEPQIILSGDHNEDGVRVLVEMLKKLDSKNNFVLCGFSPDKKADKMIEMLKPHAKEILLTEVPRARGVYAENYGTLAPFEKDPHKALSLMESKLNKDDTLIITGSLYLVGELRKKWFPKVNFILSA
jgi:dihydrofolate synthase/folylpolyglutamate synthase